MVLAGFGLERGEGLADELDRGSSSSLRRVICGVGGTELFAGGRNIQAVLIYHICPDYLRDVLLRDAGFGLLHSRSSEILGVS